MNKAIVVITLLLFLSACGSPSQTPEPILNEEDIQNTAVSVIFDAFTQTAEALPTQTQTITLFPTNTIPPTLTTIPTNTLISTPLPLPTNTIIVVFPTSAPAVGVCSCASDSLNCSDFSSHASAQACYDYCISQGRGDIHQLDRDNDGIACESL